MKSCQINIWKMKEVRQCKYMQLVESALHVCMYCTLDILSCDGVEQIELEQLLTELTEVIDWFNFGVNLEIPEVRLKVIETKCESVESCKKEMLTVWMQLAHPSWKAVVIALAGIDMKDLALRISNKYGEIHQISS